jgi:ABC-type dipeptide/oligopeptide/nickel transport system permease subunit
VLAFFGFVLASALTMAGGAPAWLAVMVMVVIAGVGYYALSRSGLGRLKHENPVVTP